MPRHFSRCRRILKWLAVVTTFAYAAVIIAVPVGDRLQQSPVVFASSGYAFNLLAYELGNFPDKWVRRVFALLPWVDDDIDARLAALTQYEDLARRLRDNAAELRESVSQDDATRHAAAERARSELLAERNRIRDIVEEYLEAELGLTLANHGFSTLGEFMWPPVDFRIDNPPSLLVTSPRHVIQRMESRLVDTDLTEQQKLAVEDQLLHESDLSALILRTGGLAAYPNIVPSDYDLLPLLEVSAHEWLHAYLLFQPLGRAYWDGGDMTSLNETLAQIFGKEIGRITYNRISGNDINTMEPPPSVTAAEREDQEEEDPDRFDFRQFMFDTRQWTDELLENGRIDEAESYMERRRLELVQNGYHIRKLNQAYFAFHGLYAAGSASTSPLARQLWELRLQSEDIGNLVRTLQPVSDYDQFLTLLDERDIER